MRRRKPDELSYNVSSIRQVLTGTISTRRVSARNSHHESSQRQRQMMYSNPSNSPVVSVHQSSLHRFRNCCMWQTHYVKVTTMRMEVVVTALAAKGKWLV
ncbi:hypothetical protein EON65_30665 [archaeon]|nr:MAG: hypothetical protein EON65_30665 [archaeon]